MSIHFFCFYYRFNSPFYLIFFLIWVSVPSDSNVLLTFIILYFLGFLPSSFRFRFFPFDIDLSRYLSFVPLISHFYLILSSIIFLWPFSSLSHSFILAFPLLSQNTVLHVYLPLHPYCIPLCTHSVSGCAFMCTARPSMCLCLGGETGLRSHVRLWGGANAVTGHTLTFAT